jgi:GTP-binding protein
VLTVSAKTGKGIDVLLGAAFEIREQWNRRVATGELNRWFEQAIDANPPPAPGGKRIKLRYITQVKTRPPSFVVFGNRLDDLPDSYRRYLINAMKRDLKIGPVPLRLDFRGRSNPFDRRR